MMNKETFANNVLNVIKEKLGDYYKVTLQPITKNNGLNLLGLVIQKHNNSICPQIYLDGYYNHFIQGRNFDEIIEDILDTYSDSMMNTDVSLEWINDKEAFLSKVAFKLINRDMNLEMLENIPYEPVVGDLVKVFYLVVSMNGDGGTILVHNGLIERIGISLEELSASATKNTPVLLPVEMMRIETALAQMMDSSEDEFPMCTNVGMHIITNQRKVFGAAVLCYEGLMTEVCNKLGGSIYIIPSSTHEIIVLRADNSDDVEYLTNMIREVNETQVALEERLSDHLYYYDAISQTLSVA